jgi:hypothetical protein
MPKPRIRVGTYAATTMTDTYAVQNFPIQSDQRNYPWRVITPTETAREFDAQTDGVDGTRRYIGKWNGGLYFTAITPEMYQYVRLNLFPTNGVNEALTFVIYVVNKGWVCIQADCQLNQLAEVGQSRPQARFTEGVRLIEFGNGELNTGGAFTSGFSSGFDLGGIPE